MGLREKINISFKEGESSEFYIRFTSPNKEIFPIFSWLIKIYDWWFDASHVQIMWRDKDYDEIIIYEASGTNVHFVGSIKQNEEPWKIAHIFKVTVSKEMGWKTVKWCKANAGVGYDLKAIFGFIPVKIAGWFGKEIENPWGKGPYQQFCSEMVGFIMRDVWGYDMEVELNKAGPKAIYKRLLLASVRFSNIEKVI